MKIKKPVKALTGTSSRMRTLPHISFKSYIEASATETDSTISNEMILLNEDARKALCDADLEKEPLIRCRIH
jgi:hypothetical protein